MFSPLLGRNERANRDKLPTSKLRSYLRVNELKSCNIVSCRLGLEECYYKEQ